MLIALLTACQEAPVEVTTVHEHTFRPKAAAIEPSLFRYGQPAYQQCDTCGEIADAQGYPIQELQLPKLSPKLTLWIGDEPTDLTLTQETEHQLLWAPITRMLQAGEILSLRSTDDPTIIHSYTPLENLDANGAVISDAVQATITLEATPDAITLSVSYEQFQGPVLSWADTSRILPTREGGYTLPLLDLTAGQTLHLTDPRLEATVTIAEDGVYTIQCRPAEGIFTATPATQAEIREAAEAFDRQILLCPSYLERYYRQTILDLYSDYALMSRQVKKQLKAAPKLEAMYSRLESDQPITYHLATAQTLQVYSSRSELFQGFFTDFYYYICVFHGTSQLRRYDIHDVADFLSMASDLEGGGHSELAGIGYAAAGYLLEPRCNDVIHAQSEDGFLGFCYQNGLYLEQIPFFIRFYAYWRLDEGWATPKNCYADLFSETWAPTVDIAKFFYYDEVTSPLRTARMLDCITAAAGVVYDMEGDLPNPRLRGYLFEGWYLDADFTQPATQLPQTQESITLYAKWSIDHAQQDRDSAALVDVYLYNFFTNWASRNATTTGYLLELYQSLSDNAKALLTETTYLNRFLKDYAKLSD